MRCLFASAFLLVAYLGVTTLAHVALTFPPARTLDLDFLDTFRTKGKCGMSKGTVRTSLQAGTRVRVEWHLGYPHRGGFKLELLDSRENKLRDLTPNDLYVGTEDKTLQSFELDLDSTLVCKECTIRLERQALEWGPNYRFQSCADVDIVRADDYKNTCSGHGSSSGASSCTCDRLYFGQFCQFKNDCETDRDCSGHGQCIDLGGSALPRKQCFCTPGHLGPACESPSTLTQADRDAFNPANYTKTAFRAVDFYYRLVNEGKELEGVVVGKSTTSFLAFGWRPSTLDATCQDFPSQLPPPNRPSGNALHGMDCTDIVIGAAKGNLGRVGDYYTRDRSTPRLDTIYDPAAPGLTGSLAWESNGVTTVMFRKPARPDASAESTDHAFAGPLHVIWAHGQSGVDFYAEDEIKYHGGNRGVGKMEVSSALRPTTLPGFAILAAAFAVVLINSSNL